MYGPTSFTISFHSSFKRLLIWSPGKLNKSKINVRKIKQRFSQKVGTALASILVVTFGGRLPPLGDPTVCLLPIIIILCSTHWQLLRQEQSTATFYRMGFEMNVSMLTVPQTFGI